MSESLVKNAASAKQVKASGDKEKRRREAEMSDLRAVMKTNEGQRVLWRFSEHCRPFGSVHHPSGSQVYYNAGQQDVGHFLIAEMMEADQEQFFKMMKDSKGYNNV